MNVLFRSLIVWLMLLALPFQGYASAQMMLCVVPAQASTMAAGPHDHAAMLAAQDQHAQHQSSDDSSTKHTNMKCSGSACCAAAAPILALELPAALLPSASAVPFYSGFLPAVDLAHPERPPQGHHA
ncbi:hypothetical protein [Duganella sp. BuS-21]|uniref:hypothetical protein n=1 Tax=Duganella sp. BuS-21 TaxID=2943848 RepID=UPI0035A5E731